MTLIQTQPQKPTRPVLSIKFPQVEPKKDLATTIVSGMIAGAGFTAMSHAPHVVYTVGQKLKVDNKFHSYAKVFQAQTLKTLTAGLGVRSLQGALTFGTIYTFMHVFEKAAGINDSNRTSASQIGLKSATGLIENPIVRQPFLTISGALITGQKPNIPLTIKTLPQSTFLRVAYLGAAASGSEVGKWTGDTLKLPSLLKDALGGGFAALVSTPFIGAQERATAAINHGLPLERVVTEAIEGGKTALKESPLVIRESMFLIPLVAKEHVIETLEPFVQPVTQSITKFFSSSET